MRPVVGNSIALVCSMGIESFQPGPTGSPLVQEGKVVGHISFGGDLLLMPIGAKTVLFELHRYFGPHPVSKNTFDPLERIPKGFWDAWERWGVGGKLVDGETCVLKPWCETCEGSGDEKRHAGGRNYEITGKCKSCNGARLAPLRWAAESL